MSACIQHGSWGDYCGPECERLTRAWSHPRFRFLHRVESRYFWARDIPGDSRQELVSCDVDWFWGKR